MASLAPHSHSASAEGRPGSASGASGASNSASGQTTKDAFNAALRARSQDNNYIAHLRIWEQVDASENAAGAPPGASAPAGGPLTRKARYLILAVQRGTGRVTINKAKRNADHTFSVGKDWDLNTLREIAVTEPTQFSLTFARSYSWTTDRAREQSLFLSSVVNVYRRYTRDVHGPMLSGFSVSAGGSGSGSRPPTHSSPPTSSQQDGPAAPSSAPTRAPLPQAPISPPRVAEEPRRPQPALEVTRPPAPVRSVSADASADAETLAASGRRRPSDVAVPDGFYEPGTSRQAVGGPSSGLLSPLTRRPTLMRNDSAVPRLEGNEAHDATVAALGSPTSPTSALPPPSGSSQESTNQPTLTGKDKLSDRLARVAAGANGGFSPPARQPDSTAKAAPQRAGQRAVQARPSTSSDAASPAKATEAPAAAPSRPQPQRQDSSGSTLSVANARTRLSSIEPVAARGGKAYERMLLAGTGLKSIGDDDEEEEEDVEEEDEEQLEEEEEVPAEDDDAYGGAIIGQTSPPKRLKTLKTSKSMLRKGQKTRAGQNGGHNGAAAAALDDSDEDDATLINVEEMLDGIDFRAVHNDPRSLAARSIGLSGYGSRGAYSGSSALLARTKGQGTADIIEASLLSELEALDSANIHSILNGDDRLSTVLAHVDSALTQLDAIDSLVASFKVSLNSRAEDIGFIEGQNRGLQVMNSNWRALQREIEQLSQTVNIPAYEVERLLAPDFEATGSIEAKESAAASLYKAILQARTSQIEERNTGMAATTERLEEYSSISKSFGHQIQQYLSALFQRLTAALLADPARKSMLQSSRPKLTAHDAVEAALGSYCGLLLYVKEVEPKTFERISAAYLTSAAERYKEECSRLMGTYRGQIRKAASEEDSISSFAPDGTASGAGTTALGRATTVRRLGGATAGTKKGKNSAAEGEVNGSEAFNYVLISISPLITQESLFLSDFLHLNSNGLTFADYMSLETYFRRRAAALFSEDSSERRGGLREMRGAMELVFGFLSGEMEGLLEEVGKRDQFQTIGALAALDAAKAEAEGAGNEFLTRTLHKLHAKAQAALEHFFANQIRSIVASANKSQAASSGYAPSFRGKKGGRGGLAQPVRVLPHFVDRVEAQLASAQHLPVRSVVDAFYVKLEQTVVDTLLSLKVDTAYGSSGTQDEDKGVMNHQVLLIENMHHLVQEVKKLVGRAPAMQSLAMRSEKMYEDSLSHYVHFVLRRPLGKMMDFSDGIDGLRSSTPANEVQLHNAFSKAAFKRLTKEYTSKDVRKQVDALWRRVLKHFDEDEDETFSISNPARGSSNPTAAAMLDSDELMVGPAAEEEERKRVVAKVWRRCEADFVREVERLSTIQNECYKGSGTTLEIQVSDVVRLFQR
ncbi:unnamed protein product [Parajaminaea phylloscopi]